MYTILIIMEPEIFSQQVLVGATLPGFEQQNELEPASWRDSFHDQSTNPDTVLRQLKEA